MYLAPRLDFSSSALGFVSLKTADRTAAGLAPRRIWLTSCAVVFHACSNGGFEKLYRNRPHGRTYRSLSPPESEPAPPCGLSVVSLAKPRLRVNQDERKDFVHDGSDPGVCRFGADRRGRSVVDAVRPTSEVDQSWKIQLHESI